MEDTTDSKQMRLRRMKGIAGGMLILMIIIFTVARWIKGLGDQHQLPLAALILPILPYVIAFSEAAIVGALADWFAITALFRSPLGIPLPHTAIIPNSRRRIGDALGTFIEKNFLDPDIVSTRLENLDLAEECAKRLRTPDTAQALSDRLTRLVPHFVEALDTNQTYEFIERQAMTQIQQTDFSRMAQSLIVHSSRLINYDTIIEEILDISHDFVRDNKDKFKDRISVRSDWWIPSFVDERLYNTMIAAIEDILQDLADPDHERREKMRQALKSAVIKLQDNQDFLDKFNELRDQAVTSDTVASYIHATWDRIKHDLKQDTQHDESHVRTQITHFLITTAHMLEVDEAARTRLNRVLHQIVIQTVLPYRHSFAQFVASIVQGWNGREIAKRLELNIGHELQFIRINGTLVGGCVGVIVYLISETLFSHT